jgi:signal transduction histidine kinase
VAVDATRVSAAGVIGEPSGLARVVRNLLENAERHARSRITVRLGETDAQAVLVVEDDGPGIPVERREAIFERFTRLDDARARDAGGAGLGLAIAQSYAHAHGGELLYEDARPHGARFELVIPRAARR